MSMPRPEYPRPQFVRPEWLCLNGEWEFEIDSGDSGLERGLLERPLTDRIIAPFAPESELSGVGCTDFMNAVWYRRTFTVPEAWAQDGHTVLLHFQAVDYDATVWANGVQVGRHRGGFTPFTCDLEGIAEPGRPLTIVVRAQDDTRAFKPVGKQSQRYGNFGCHYTRTTGIWQTVWLEPVPTTRLERTRITPDLANGCFHLEQPVARPRAGLVVHARLLAEGRVVASDEVSADVDLAPRLLLAIPEADRRCWSLDDPFLYDLEIELLDVRDDQAQCIDAVQSYAGLRSVSLDGKAVRLSGEVVFQRLVLDQGYYPDGIMTAPSDEALVRDIELSIAAGFNGARLHQKVFEERFLYHADRLGYLVWGEFGDWGCCDGARREDNQRVSATYITQWLEALERDYSHPSIVGWCPLNETWQPLTDRITALDDVTHGMYLAAKAMDTSRPVLDASGYSHRVVDADIYDSHDYDQNPATFAERHAGLAEDAPFVNTAHDREISVPYRGQPYFVSEFGGIWWNPNAKPGEDSWGYGERVKSLEEFYERFEGLVNALLDHPDMFGYCYTQLTDVFQEQNGVVGFDRALKFDMARLCAIQRRTAAIEEDDRKRDG